MHVMHPPARTELLRVRKSVSMKASPGVPKNMYYAFTLETFRLHLQLLHVLYGEHIHV